MSKINWTSKQSSHTFNLKTKKRKKAMLSGHIKKWEKTFLHQLYFFVGQNVYWQTKDTCVFTG